MDNPTSTRLHAMPEHQLSSYAVHLQRVDLTMTCERGYYAPYCVIRTLVGQRLGNLIISYVKTQCLFFVYL
jgi:hypothetical protein